MRVLFIAPFPPPITGHSLAAKVFHDELALRHETTMVNLSVGSANDGSVSGRRIKEVSKVLARVWRERGGADAVYLTVSESVAGNLKDLFIYLIFAGRLSRVYIHLHGGSIKKLLFDRHPLLRRLNAWAIRRMGGVVISGHSHEHIFAGMIDRRRIHIVPNFAQEELFVTEQAIRAKFGKMDPLRVLYISGMTAGKGYLDLADAFALLSEAAKRRIQIDFAGKFDTEAEERIFRTRIAGMPAIRYHGLVDDARKRALFAQAHVFCLPTTMFEGQPISILEAYASGCVVLATGQDGIRDVFAQGRNGCEVEQHSPGSIAGVLDEVVAGGEAPLLSMALDNRRQAEERYRTAIFGARLRRIIEGADTAAPGPMAHGGIPATKGMRS
jgi:glycosyltransferase involved in cell wall biosynthesis